MPTSKPRLAAVILLPALILIPFWPADGAPPASDKESSAARIWTLIDKAIIARERAYLSIPRAQGAGTYSHTTIRRDGTATAKVRARLQVAYERPKELILFRYEPGAGHPDPDFRARIVMSDGKRIYESEFCRRILPRGVRAKTLDSLEEGLLLPVFDPSIGYLAKAYGFIDRRQDDELETSLRDQGDLKVIQQKDPQGEYAQEFWIDPSKGFHIVRYRVTVYRQGNGPLVVSEVNRQWQRTDDLWYVQRFTEKGLLRDERGDIYATQQAELVLESFKPNITLPKDLFTVHALGLLDGTRIGDYWTGKEVELYLEDTEFDKARIEQVVGKLPKPLR